MKSIMDFLEHQWVNFINNTVSRYLAKDKFLSLQKLANNSIPVPKTILLKWIPNIDFIETQLSYPIILKKIEWSHWKGIIKVNNREDLEDIIEMLSDSVFTLNKNVILQEYIWEKAGQDLRFFIVGWRIIWSMLRKWKEGDFKSNYSWGWNVFQHTPNEKEEILALESANIIWLDIAWIDILFDKDNWYKICEVNASPWFEWLEEATWLNIASEIINYIIKRYNINIKS
jgi:RimK family alpha-L-glutamate ligase